MPACIQYVRVYCEDDVYKVDIILSDGEGGVPDTFTGLEVDVESCEPFCGSVEIPDTGTVCPDGATLSLSSSPSGCGATYDCVDGNCVENVTGDGEYSSLPLCVESGCIGGSGISATLIESDVQAGTLPQMVVVPDVSVPSGGRLVVALYSAITGGTGVNTAADISFAVSFDGSSIASPDVSQTHAGESGETSGGLVAVYSVGIGTATTGDVEITFDLADPEEGAGILSHYTVLYISNLPLNAVDVTASATAHDDEPSTGTTSSTTENAEYVLAAFGVVEASDTPPGFNVNTDFTPDTPFASLSSAGDSYSALITAYRITTATGTQLGRLIPDPLLSSTIHAGVVVAYK